MPLAAASALALYLKRSFRPSSPRKVARMRRKEWRYRRKPETLKGKADVAAFRLLFRGKGGKFDADVLYYPLYRGKELIPWTFQSETPSS